MTFADVLFTAFSQLKENKLRSFFTLLGIIVSVTFLVAVVAIIQGMNSYVSVNLAGALIGANTFQVRKKSCLLGLMACERVFGDASCNRVARPSALGSSSTFLSAIFS